MADSEESDPPVVKTAPVVGVVVATLFTLAVGTVIGFVLAYVAAILVVKVGLPFPKLVVGLPLIAVGGIAWRMTNAQGLRESVVTILTAGAIAIALFFAWGPARPAVLFTTKSEVTGVKVKGDDAEIRFKSSSEMTSMPPVLPTLGYATLLACFAVIASTIGHGVMRKRSLDAQ